MKTDPSSKPASNQTGMAGTSRKRILLVEDEAIIAFAEKKDLERCGYDVLTVTSGQKAIEVCKMDKGIDLILMDIDLGRGMDGTEAASQILQNQDIPIVFLSSHTEPDVVARTEAISSYGYVVKNSSTTALDASIKMSFKLFKANQETLAINKKLEATLDALPELLFEIDLDGRYWDVHCPDPSLLFKPVEELVGLRISELLPIPAATTIMSAIAEANEKGLSTGKQYELLVQSGARWFETTVSRMASMTENPHFIVFCQDITERIRMEEALSESDRRYREMSDMKEERKPGMKASKIIAVLMMALLLIVPLAASAQENIPGAPLSDRPSQAFRTGGWILVGSGAVLGVLGGLLLVEGFTTDNPDTADFGKMMGIGTMVAGGLSAGVGIFLIKVPLK